MINKFGIIILSSFLPVAQSSCKSRSASKVQTADSNPCDQIGNYDQCTLVLIASMSADVEQISKTYKIALNYNEANSPTQGMALSQNDDIKEALNQIQADIKNLRKNGVKSDQNIESLDKQIGIMQSQIAAIEKNGQQLSPDVEQKLREMVLKASMTVSTVTINVVGGVGVNNGTVVINNVSNPSAVSPAADTPKRPIPATDPEALAIADSICVAQFLSDPIDKCRLDVVKIRFLDVKAMKICGAAFLSAARLNCMMKIKEKTYDSRETQVCGGKFLADDRLNCLYTTGTPLF